MSYQLSASSIALLKEMAQWYRQNKGRLGANFRRNPRLQSTSTGGGGGGTVQRGQIIVAPTFQDPYANQGTTEYAGYGYYKLRPTAKDTWDITGETEYALGAEVVDSTDAYTPHRAYVRIGGEEMNDPTTAPHLNPTDWEESEEIKIEYASCYYNRTSETGMYAIKDCWPAWPPGCSLKYTSFKKSDNSTIYLLEESVIYVNTPELRNLLMLGDAGMAGYI
ncbi:MAG TPA: hypothetical protein DC049_07955 [Spirochaetia bacterium]|nr:hypothetical protein [Spirochaetia bacterium]